jgi:hypothetical protein
MITLCIRYTFNPDKLADLRTYFETEQGVIEHSGGKIGGYFLPTDFAGPTNEALGLIDLRQRHKQLVHPNHSRPRWDF